MKHQSGSLAAWKARREEYRKRSGPVSNPGDGRVRKDGRRSYARAQRKAYLLDWDEALALNALPQEPQ